MMKGRGFQPTSSHTSSSASTRYHIRKFTEGRVSGLGLGYTSPSKSSSATEDASRWKACLGRAVPSLSFSHWQPIYVQAHTRMQRPRYRAPGLDEYVTRTMHCERAEAHGPQFVSPTSLLISTTKEKHYGCTAYPSCR